MGTIALSGEFDIATVPVLEQHFARLEGDGVTAIMLDLRELTFLDCAGAVCDRRRTGSRQRERVPSDPGGASSPARRLFELTGTQFLLDERTACRCGQPDSP